MQRKSSVPFEKEKLEERILVTQESLNKSSQGGFDLLLKIRKNEDNEVFAELSYRLKMIWSKEEFALMNIMFQLDPKMERRKMTYSFSMKMKFLSIVSSALNSLSLNELYLFGTRELKPKIED